MSSVGGGGGGDDMKADDGHLIFSQIQLSVSSIVPANPHQPARRIEILFSATHNSVELQTKGCKEFIISTMAFSWLKGPTNAFHISLC